MFFFFFVLRKNGVSRFYLISCTLFGRGRSSAAQGSLCVCPCVRVLFFLNLFLRVVDVRRTVWYLWAAVKRRVIYEDRQDRLNVIAAVEYGGKRENMRMLVLALLAPEILVLRWTRPFCRGREGGTCQRDLLYFIVKKTLECSVFFSLS